MRILKKVDGVEGALWLASQIPFAIYLRTTREKMASRFASVTSEEIIHINVEAAPENKESDLISFRHI